MRHSIQDTKAQRKARELSLQRASDSTAIFSEMFEVEDDDNYIVTQFAKMTANFDNYDPL